MSVIAFGSVKASPGATTALLATAAIWPAARPVTIVEADPDGGSLAARSGLRIEPGIVTAAAAGRHGLRPEHLVEHCQLLPGGTRAVVGPADPDEAARAISVLAPPLAAALPRWDGDVLIDAGRIRAGSPAHPLLACADVVLVTARPRLDELSSVAPRMRALAASGCPARLLLVGEHPYAPEAVAAELGVPVSGPIAHDPDAAAMLAGQGGTTKRLRRSQLVRSAADLVEQLTGTEQPQADASTPLTGGQDRRASIPLGGRSRSGTRRPA